MDNYESDSDDDLFRYDPNFKTTASAKKRPRTETTTPTVTNTDISPEKAREDQRAKDTQKAQKRVHLRTVPSEMKDPNQLFWYIKKGKGRKATEILHPCRTCDKGEGEHLFGDFDENKKKLVQYLDTNSQMQIVTLSNLVPYHGQKETDVEEYKWSPELLKKFRIQCEKSKNNDFKDTVGVLEAELYLEKVMDIAVQRMKECREREKLHDHVDFDTLISKPPPSNHNACKIDADSPGSAIVTQVEEEDDSDDMSMPIKKSLSTKKVGTLRVGEILQFYEPTATFGDPEKLRETIIQKIDAKKRDDSDICLTMKGGFYLQRSHKVRRVKKIYNKKLKNCDIGWKRVSDYSLKGGTLEGAIGMKEEGEKLGQIIEKNKQESKQQLKANGFGHFVDAYR